MATDAEDQESLGLDRHLRAIRVPRSVSVPGACAWVQPCDLLGGAHRIEASWTSASLTIRRMFSDPSCPESETWSMTATVDGGGRWAFCGGQGVLFEEISSIKDALARVRDQVKGLGVGAVVADTSVPGRRLGP